MLLGYVQIANQFDGRIMLGNASGVLELIFIKYPAKG